MKKLRLVSTFFVIGSLIPCSTILCFSSELGTPAILFHFIGAILPSTIISLLIAIVTFSKSRTSQNKSCRLRVQFGLILFIKTFLQQSGQFWEGSSEESYPRLKVQSDQKRTAQWIAYKIF